MRLESETTDLELICSLKQGDQLAFDLIFERYWKHLYNVAFNETKSAALTEEVVKDVFTELWIHRSEVPVTDAVDYLSELTGKKVIEKRFVNGFG